MPKKKSGNSGKKVTAKGVTGRFWEQKAPEDMTHREWEMLCDGCGKCCVKKIRNSITGGVDYTNVCCRLLDPATARCTAYARRHRLVPDCLDINPSCVGDYDWLPESCAYRLIHQGKPLPQWHHLVSGDRDLIHRLGFSVRNRVISEEYIHPLQLPQHIVQWE